MERREQQRRSTEKRSLTAAIITTGAAITAANQGVDLVQKLKSKKPEKK